MGSKISHEKIFFSFLILALLVVTFVYLIFIRGWMEFRWNRDTPKAFLSHVEIKKENYSKDSVEIWKQLHYFLSNHKQSFYNKEYFDSTQVIIDTILYSPNFNKLSVFVITKNPTYRQLIGDKTYDFYYDGYGYFGNKQKDTIDITWIGPLFLHSHSKQRVSNLLREYFFREFATIKDASGQYQYKYNLNDVRFWTCPIWKEIDKKKEDEKEFEDMKKKHPENVYEPKY
jgi:hypothetical protein